MRRTLKIGLIGAGHMGMNHARVLSDEKRFDFIGVYDENSNAARKCSEEYGVKMFLDTESLYKEIDCVVIAVPSILHNLIGMEAARFGKHALIEKPLHNDSGGAVELCNEYKQRGLVLMAGHVERYNPVVRELFKMLRDEKIFYIEARRYSPFSSSGRVKDTNVVKDLMIHDLDIILEIMRGSEVASVASFGNIVQSNSIDIATAILSFNGGTYASVSASRVSQNKERKFCIHTEDNYYEADLLKKTLTVSKSTNLTFNGEAGENYCQEGVLQMIFVPNEEPLRNELIHFYDLIVKEKDFNNDIESAVQSVQLCETISEQIHF